MQQPTQQPFAYQQPYNNQINGQTYPNQQQFNYGGYDNSFPPQVQSYPQQTQQPIQQAIRPQTQHQPPVLNQQQQFRGKEANNYLPTNTEQQQITNQQQLVPNRDDLSNLSNQMSNVSINPNQNFQQSLQRQQMMPPTSQQPPVPSLTQQQQHNQTKPFTDFNPISQYNDFNKQTTETNLQQTIPQNNYSVTPNQNQVYSNMPVKPEPAPSQMNPVQQPPMTQRYPQAPTRYPPPPTQYPNYQQQRGTNQYTPGPQTPTEMQPQQPYPYPPSGPAGSMQRQMQQPQQRLDPDSMPSVLQVIDDDKKKFCSNSEQLQYMTTVPATVPPNVTTMMRSTNPFIQDGGCSRPNHIRSTIYNVPVSEDILKIACVPLSIIVKPFDESEVDGNMVVPVTDSEILRCNRCQAYMNPFMRFIDGGRRFQCALCHHISDVSTTYFAHLDHTGQRLDKFERPELSLGSYEFKATAEFFRKGMMACRRPHIIFAFELTVNSRPLIDQLSKSLPDVIRNYLPTDPLNPGSPPPLVGFMTYNSKIQMYDIVNNGHAYIVCDVSSSFPPFTSFLVDPVECIEQIESFLSSLPNLVPYEELETETILGPVIEAALITCQHDNANWFDEQLAANPSLKDPSKVISVGKVYLFHCTLPTYGQDGVTPGRLKQRWTTSADEIRQLLGTDKEKQILSPEPSKYYNELAQKCVTDYGSGVELFLFPPVNGSFLDIASLSELVRLTGSGGIYKYYNEYSDRFITDLKNSLKSSFGFDAVIKVRTSTGIRPLDYYGNYYGRVKTDVECGVVNAGANIVVDIRYDDKLPEDECAIIQVATLYTSVSGDRRVRIHNIALNVCQQVAEVFRNACCDSVINVLIRNALFSLRLGEKTVLQVKESLISRIVSILTAYRRHCANSGSSLGQLILPEALKVLPMYLVGALKCDAIDGGPEMLPDDKALAQILTLGAQVELSQAILYPRLLRIEYDENDSETLITTQIRCSCLKVDNNPNGVAYLLENSFYTFLYIPTSIVIEKQSQFLKNVFDVNSVQEIVVDRPLPELLTNESQFMNQLLNNVIIDRRRTTKLTIVRQSMDKTELVFRNFLYEDNKNKIAGSNSGSKFDSPNYVDLLCHLHKEIRAQLN